MRGFALALLTLLAACAQPVAIVDETSRPPLPEASYAAAARSGAAVYRIVPHESLILIRVGRAGAMKRLGHDHAVASEDVQGLVELRDDPSASRADVVLPLRNLVVDRPEYRGRLGLNSGPTTADVAGTYTNMLKALEPALYPWVLVHARLASVGTEQPTLSVSITLHGAAIEYLMPVNLEIDATRLVVSGRTTIRQSEFGLVPHNAVGGLLRVADELEVEFRLVGHAVAMP